MPRHWHCDQVTLGTRQVPELLRNRYDEKGAFFYLRAARVQCDLKGETPAHRGGCPWGHSAAVAAPHT